MAHLTDQNLVAVDQMTLRKKQTVNNRRQFSSFVLFLSVVVLLNLCPFHDEFNYEKLHPQTGDNLMPYEKQVPQSINLLEQIRSPMTPMNLNAYLVKLDSCLRFVKLMFSNPIRLGPRTVRFTQAEARMLGKMAKVWYIKKKIKKLSKKLKKHTIAVPVFTAIPIYEHSYYPQPHVTHVTHGMHHAASSYMPSVIAAPASPTGGSGAGSAAAAAAGSSQQMVTSASNTNQHVSPAAYKISAAPSHHHPARHPAMYMPMHAAGAHQIINSYPPSPPLYVDEAGGLYGHYGNAYGRYDGGYQMW